MNSDTDFLPFPEKFQWANDILQKFKMKQEYYLPPLAPNN